MQKKKMLAMALAGVMSLGVYSTVVMATTEAASHHEKIYADGTTNEYSHRMHEEDVKHNQIVRSINYEHRKGRINDKEHAKQLKEEQQRHDKVMRDIKRDYEAHNHHRSK